MHKPSRSRKALIRLGLPVLGVLLSAMAALAHDFWLVPDAFVVATGGEIAVRGQTSSRFPTSEAAVALDRIADARVLDATGATPIRHLSHAGSSLLIRHRPTSPGQRVVAVTLHPRSVRESAEGFRRYLVLEGAPEALERYEREGRLSGTDSLTRRYAKYAKTLVEVGGGGPRAFSRVAGHPLEFVPLRDPAGLTAGDTLAVRLLYGGRPLAGARIHADGVPGEPDLSPEAAAEKAVTVDARTDAQGVARVPVQRGGVWNVRAIHVVPADPGSGAAWETHWATLVFGVEPAAATQGDSTEVARTVDRFHRALTEADSATVLSLLTPGAVILESGGMETRAEYRLHHLPADIAFARVVERERGPIRVTVRGETAWAASTSTAVGEYRGRAVDSRGAELMVLTRTPEGWRIAAIHWSSRARPSS